MGWIILTIVVLVICVPFHLVDEKQQEEKRKSEIEKAIKEAVKKALTNKGE